MITRKQFFCKNGKILFLCIIQYGIGDTVQKIIFLFCGFMVGKRKKSFYIFPETLTCIKMSGTPFYTGILMQEAALVQ